MRKRTRPFFTPVVLGVPSSGAVTLAIGAHAHERPDEWDRDTEALWKIVFPLDEKNLSARRGLSGSGKKTV